MRYENIAATELNWINDPAKVRSFLLDTFLNRRGRLRLRTARLWKVLIDQYLARDTAHRPSRAEIGQNFGYDENTIKINLFRLRRQAEHFFASGGKYTPCYKERRPPKPYDPLTCDLDVPLYKGLKQWRQPVYKMRQKGPFISSSVQIVIPDDDAPTTIDLLDSFSYDHERYKGWVSRLPMPEDIHTAESRAFLKAYEFDLYCQTKVQHILAKKAGKAYDSKCKCKGENNPKDLERRTLFSFDADQTTRRAPIKPKESRSLCIKVKLGRCWTIEDSRYGRGEILKVNGNTVCCKFIEAGRVNFSVATIQRKTGINLKKEACLKEALRIVRQRYFPVEQQPEARHTANFSAECSLPAMTAEQSSQKDFHA